MSLPPISIPFAANMTAFNAGLAAAATKIDMLSAKAGAVGKSMSNVGSSMMATGMQMGMALTLPLVAAEKSVTGSFLKFDKALTEAMAVNAAVTKEQKQRASDTAKTLSTELAFSADKLAQSFFYLFSAGLDAEQAIKALGPTARFAMAGVFDLETAVSLAMDSLMSMGMESKNAVENQKNLIHVTDVLVKANASADASVLEFSKSLTNYAGSTGRMFGKSIEEVVSVLEEFAMQGTKAQKAGMLYAMVMRYMSQASIKNRDVFDKMNISVYDTAGNMRDMADIVGDMENAFAGMSPEQVQMSLLELGFTAKALGGITKLLGKSEDLKRFKQGLMEAGGATKRMSDEQMTAWANKIELVHNRLNLAAITIGEKLTPHIYVLKSYIADMVEGFSKLADTTQWTIVKIAALAAAMPIVLFFAGAILKSFGSVLFLFSRIGLVVAGLASTFGGFIFLLTGVAAAAVAFFAAFDPTKSFGQNVKASIDGIRSGFERITGAIKEAADSVWTVLGPAIHDVWRSFEPDIKNIGDQLRSFLDDSVDITSQAIKNVGGFFTNFAQNMVILDKWVLQNQNELFTSALSWYWEYTKAQFVNTFSFLKRVIDTFFMSLDHALRFAASTIGNVFSNLWNAVFHGGDFEKNFGDAMNKATENFNKNFMGELSEIWVQREWAGPKAGHFKNIPKFNFNLDLASKKAEDFAKGVEKSTDTVNDAADQLETPPGGPGAGGPTTPDKDVESLLTNVTTSALQMGTAEAFTAAYRGSNYDTVDKKIEQNTDITAKESKTQTMLLEEIADSVSGGLGDKFEVADI